MTLEEKINDLLPEPYLVKTISESFTWLELRKKSGWFHPITGKALSNRVKRFKVNSNNPENMIKKILKYC